MHRKPDDLQEPPVPRWIEAALGRSWSDLVVLVVALLLVAAGLLPALTEPMNSDIGWLLYASEAWLDGAALYVDLVETNPPLVIWVYAPAVLLGRLLQTSAYVGLLIWVCTLLAAATALTFRLLARLEAGQSSAVRRWLLLLLVLGLFVLVGRSFGQKDHLIVAFLLPYVVLLVARTEGTRTDGWLRVVAGASAAVAVCLKPHFLIVLVALEGIHRLFAPEPVDLVRSETATLVGVSLLYPVAVLVWSPEYLGVVERFGSLYAGHTQLTLSSVLQHPSILFLGIATLVWSLAVGPPGRRRLAAALLGSGALALLVAVLQMKGWSYHFLPALVFGVLALGIVLLLHGTSRRITRWMRGTTAAVLLMAFAFACWSVFTIASERSAEEIRLERMTDLLAGCGDDDVLAVLSPRIDSSFPLVNETGMRWGLRHHYQWPLTTALMIARRSATEDTSSRLVAARDRWKEVQRETLADLTTRPPEYLLVDDRAARLALGPAASDLRAAYGSYREFTDLMTDYVSEGRVEGYRIWRRALPSDGSDPCRAVAEPRG